MVVSRSIDIEAPASKVYSKLNDFKEWTPWSPWLIMDPEAEVKIAENAKFYEWEGKRVGSGKMKIIEEKENHFVAYDLHFLKPWKSKAKTSFTLDEKEGKTTVTWNMDSSLPFFMFWMKKMMEGFVGLDFDRGLGMLKPYVEQGMIPSKLEFLGRRNFDGFHFIGMKTTCDIDKVGERMSSDFGRLSNYLNDQPALVDGRAFSIYHQWDIVKGTVSYTSGISIKQLNNGLPSDFVNGTIPANITYALRHTGPYQHLGNAWGTLYAMSRNKEFKPNKKIDPFEIYLNNPQNTAPNELITEVCFPVK